MLQTLLVLQLMSILLLAMESIYIAMLGKTRQQFFLFIFCFSALINNVGYLFEMTSSGPMEALRCIQFLYLGKLLIPISFFVIIMSFCEVKLSQKFYLLIISINAAVWGLVLTCERHNLYYSSKEFVNTGLFPHYQFGHSPIYNFHILVIESMTIIGVFVMVSKFREETSKQNKRTIGYLLLATLIMTGSLLIYMSGITQGYDFTSMGYFLASIVLLLAIFKGKIMDNLTLVHDYVADVLSEGVVALNQNDSVVYYNEAFVQIFPDIADNEEQVIRDIRILLEQDKVIGKGEQTYSIRREPMKNGEEVRGEIYVFADITERYRYMEELQRQKEIAEEANASKSAFLSIVSHEMRTPMNAIVGMSELLLEEKLTESQQKYLQNIKSSGAALTMLINDILDQSKIEAGKMEIVEDIYELAPIVEDVLMIIQNRLVNRPIHLLSSFDEKIPKYMIGDGLRIRQVLLNLMSNATKYTDTGYIKLSIGIEEETQEDYRLHFSVKDSGQGIRPEDMEKLGLAYSQVDVHRNHSKEGTGLGLSICKNFIHLMGGEMQVESTYGKGSEFFFEIRQKKATKQDEAAEHVRCAWKVPDFTLPNSRILVVDDTEMNRVVLSHMLEKLGSRVATAGNGPEALALVEKETYDLVFMDYRMPDMDGVETTDKIRQLALGELVEERKEYYRKLPILALTGDVSEQTKDMFLAAGINDILQKPVVLDKLKTALLQWIPTEQIVYKEQ